MQDAGPSRFVVSYLALQSSAILAWWVVILGRPELQRFFQSPDSAQGEILNLGISDPILLGLGGLAASALVARGSRHASAALWMLVGGFGYATGLCLMATLRSGGAWMALAAMIPATLLTIRCARIVATPA